MKEVEFFHAEKSKIVCDLCPHHCKLKEDQKGICRFRRRIADKIVALNYAQAASMALDPIEKKPLYHFQPGSVILSVGANGCNLKCDFCQNCEISQGDVPTRFLAVEELVKVAGAQGSIGVAFTYSEPLMWYEYVLDASKELKKAGYVSVLVTNGFIEEEPLQKLLPFVDAMNIDLKSLDEEFYKRVCKAKLESVQRTIRQSIAAGVHVELTHLLVTSWNDREEPLTKLVKWIAEVDPELPLHLSRYFPHYNYHEPATSESFMRTALQIARQELKFVYLGNIAEEDGANTYCPDCGTLIVERWGYRTSVVKLQDNACANCGRKLPFN
jgi:pyruvate formate lyase activating enzyme